MDQIVAYSPRSKLGTLLPDFPDIKDIKLPDDVPEDKVFRKIVFVAWLLEFANMNA